MSKCYTSCFLFFFTLGVVFSELFASGYPPTPYNNPTQPKVVPQSNASGGYPPTPYNMPTPQGQQPKAVPHPNAMSALDPSLLDAASRNDTNQVKSLIERGARVNATNAGGLTPLHWAAMNKNLDLIKFLVGKGANLNAKANSGQTPLDKACSAGSPETCSHFKELSQKGSTSATSSQPKSMPESKEELNRKLLDAARTNKIVKIQDLLKAGADVNAKTPEGLTPLHWAAMNGNKGAEAIKLLLQHGADVNAKALSGATPLKKAQDRGQTEAIKALETNSAPSSVGQASSEAVDKDKINQRLADVVQKSGDVATVQSLLKEGADVNFQGRDGSTILHLAALLETLDVNKLLLESGKANINAQNKIGKTPLFFAVLNKDHRVIKLYLDKGANPDIKDNKGETASETLSGDALAYFKVGEAFKYFDLPASSTFEEVARKYKQLSLQYHPDKNVGNEEEATKKFKELNEYYSIMKIHFGK